jgi:hypothetical protein
MVRVRGRRLATPPLRTETARIALACALEAQACALRRSDRALIERLPGCV